METVYRRTNVNFCCFFKQVNKYVNNISKIYPDLGKRKVSQILIGEMVTNKIFERNLSKTFEHLLRYFYC